MNTAITINNVETTTLIYEAFGRQDIGFIMEQIAPDCHWVSAGAPYLPEGGIYRGADVVSFFMKLGQNLEFTSFTPVSIQRIDDNQVIALGNMSSISRATGKTAASDWAMHWIFNDEGKVTRYQSYFDTASAHEANQP